MDRRFEGKVVVVTGAAGGIGRVTAARFAAEGAAVVLPPDDHHGVGDGPTGGKRYSASPNVCEHRVPRPAVASLRAEVLIYVCGRLTPLGPREGGLVGTGLAWLLILVVIVFPALRRRRAVLAAAGARAV
jgi:hypothetical protein